MVADATVVLRIVRERARPRRIVVVGHSWGTVLALRLAKEQPQLIDDLVLIGTLADCDRADDAKLSYLSPRLRDAAQINQLSSLRATMQTNTAAARQYAITLSRLLNPSGAVFGAMRPGRLDEIRRSTHVYTSADWERQSEATLVSIDHLLPQLLGYRAIDVTDQINVPVLFIQGALDMATPTPLVREYYDALRAPRGKRWVELQGVAHFPMWERPDEFATTLAQYLGDR
jgi:pimeloyl-ACP methyl ester carboxylesterase